MVQLLLFVQDVKIISILSLPRIHVFPLKPQWTIAVLIKLILMYAQNVIDPSISMDKLAKAVAQEMTTVKPTA